MSLPDALRDLLTAHGPSGYEEAPAAVWRRHAEAFGARSTPATRSARSPRGWPGTGDGPTVAVVGHIDEIGLIVTHIDDKGFLWFAGVGGWDPQILVGQRVERDHARRRRPGRRRPQADPPARAPTSARRSPELKELHIDIGAADGDEARALVRVGDVAVIAGEPLELPGDRVVSRVDGQPPRLLRGARGRPAGRRGRRRARRRRRGRQRSRRRTTFAGAHTVAYGVQPDVAIVVDVTHATDVPGVDERENGAHALGSGPGHRPRLTAAPEVFELLHDTAEREAIAVTVEASGRYTGTDADAMQLTRAGVPTRPRVSSRCATCTRRSRWSSSPT